MLPGEKVNYFRLACLSNAIGCREPGPEVFPVYRDVNNREQYR